MEFKLNKISMKFNVINNLITFVTNIYNKYTFSEKNKSLLIPDYNTECVRTLYIESVM